MSARASRDRRTASLFWWLGWVAIAGMGAACARASSLPLPDLAGAQSMILVLERDGGAEPLIISKNLPLEDPLTLALPAGERVRMTMLAYPCSLQGHGLPNDVTTVQDTGLPFPEPAHVFSAGGEEDVLSEWTEITGVPESIQALRIGVLADQCGYRVAEMHPLPNAISPVALVPMGPGRMLAVPKGGPFFSIDDDEVRRLEESLFPMDAARAAGAWVGGNEVILTDASGEAWFGDLTRGVSRFDASPDPLDAVVATVASSTTAEDEFFFGFGDGHWLRRAEGQWTTLMDLSDVGLVERQRMRTLRTGSGSAVLVLEGRRHVYFFAEDSVHTATLGEDAAGVAARFFGRLAVPAGNGVTSFTPGGPTAVIPFAYPPALLAVTADGLLTASKAGRLGRIGEDNRVCEGGDVGGALAALEAAGDLIVAVPDATDAVVWVLHACALPPEDGTADR